MEFFISRGSFFLGDTLMHDTNIVFIADLFLEDIPQGGAEIVNRQLVSLLEEKGYKVEEIQAFKANAGFIEKRKDCLFIVGGFLSMPPSGLQKIQDFNYILYEHDHKYVINRNPAQYVEYKIPENEIVHKNLYKNATVVVCQSLLHYNILHKNIPDLNNLYNMGGSLWSDDFLYEVERNLKDNQTNSKIKKAAILKSDNPIKRQDQAIEYCNKNSLEYDLISATNPLELYKKLCEYEYFIFFPSTPETFSRVFMEAKLAGCTIITNKLVGASTEPYSYDNPVKLLEEVRSIKNKALHLLEKHIPETPPITKALEPDTIPEISIITSVYQGDLFIDQFLQEIVQQTVFEKCELVIIDCNKNKGYEHRAITSYQKQYPNIHYYHLEEDPGVYGAWNYGIEKSTGKYITNANLDDRRAYDMLEVCYNTLQSEDFSEIDLVYPAFFVSTKPNETFYTTKSRNVFDTYDFSREAMIKCPPGCMPVWRRSLHEANGLFDESYTSAGDLEFWMRCVRNNSIFRRLPYAMGVYYFNPDGLSTSAKNNHRKTLEENKVLTQYQDVWKK
jgi:hypothetical protein